MTVGCVYLVGAGPGDPGLLTLRAAELLRRADVVAYDELVAPAILAMAASDAELLPVGRRHGHGAIAHRLHPDVLTRARAGKRVVRLKAGDPLVFGRGGEEAEELAEEGIPFEIVPGISAALGAAAYAGIPLTHRDHASQVTLATGHDADGPRGAHGPGTVALYMAGRKLAENLRRLIEDGRSPETPAAYVVAATTPQQQVIVGTLGDLPSRVAGLDPGAPALVLVGDVVGVRRRAAWFERRPPLPPGPSAHDLTLDPFDGDEAMTERTTGDPGQEKRPRRGLLLVYTGHGKGKTTAAFGLVFRALGRGMRPGIVQFIKGKWKTGERLFAETIPNLTFHVMGLGFTWESDDLSKDKAAAVAAWETARAMIAGGEHDIVVLDEITYAFHYGFLALTDVLAAIRERPAHVHVVVTGRSAPEALVALADLVTEMKPIKHPYEQGIPAQMGVDF